MMYEDSIGNTTLPNGGPHESGMSDSVRALIGWGILTLGMLVAITSQQRRF